MFPPPLTAKVEGSFAYLTIKDRLPVILTKVIDHLCREKVKICDKYGQEVAEEIKEIVGQLSQLKNEMQTNKPFTKLSDNSNMSIADDDVDIWNRELESFRNKYGEDPRWFICSWLYAECYFFRRINSAFLRSTSLKTYDPFFHQKVQGCEDSFESINILSKHLLKGIQSTNRTQEDNKIRLMQMIEISLWGNQCDLCLSAGEIVSKGGNFLSAMEGMSQNIIVTDQEQLWKYFKLSKEDRQLGIVLDNAGLELFSDLCLASLMVELNFVSSVVFYSKIRPWYVSDTTVKDFNWTLEYLRKQGGEMAQVSKIFSTYLESGIWTIRNHKFWTGPHSFIEMKKEEPDLYNELSQCSLLIFKGDLNYRKLSGDFDWPNDTPFKKALGGFLPSAILSLRTIKGGPVVGLDESCCKVRKAKQKENWGHSGEIGMIQFAAEGSAINLKSVSLVILTTGLSVFIISYLLKRFGF